MIRTHEQIELQKRKEKRAIWYLNPENRKLRINYYLKNRAKKLAYRKEYLARPGNKTTITIHRKEYRTDPEIKAARKEYARIQRAANPKYMEAKRKRQSIRQRKLGFEPINDRFPNSEGHHINSTQVIYIPVFIHKSHKHCLDNPESMIEINKLAFRYLLDTIRQI